MNYLAHLALSHRDPSLMVGNFIADDIPRKEEPLLPKDIQKGILLHRRIDTYTDKHIAFTSAVKKLRSRHRKYAPVVLDILNDHLLSRNWKRFHNESETTFHHYVYSCFEEQNLRLPPIASLHVQARLRYEYLSAYGNKKGIEDVLARMDKKTRFPSDFRSAVLHLYEDIDFFERHFIALYNDLLENAVPLK